MATPPKSPSRKGGPKITAPPVSRPSATPTSVGKSPAPKAPPVLARTEIAAKPEPFAIEPKAVPTPEVPVVAVKPETVKQETVTQSESAFSPETEPAAPVTETAKAQPAEAAPIAETPVEIEAPTPPQPDVVAPLAAAIETVAEQQKPYALEGHYIMNEAIETSKKFAEDAKSRIQSLVSDFNGKAKVALEKSSKTAEELSDITKGNVEAFVESSKIAAKGLETLGQSAAEYGRASFEKTSATLKSFASVKSPTEFFQLQSELLTSAFDALAAETSKSSEAFLKLAGDIAQPLSSRAAIVSDKIKSLAA